MTKYMKPMTSILLVLSLLLCFASCAAQPEETMESLLSAGKYDAALLKAQESGDSAAELSVTIEKKAAEAINEVLNYVQAASDVIDEGYVYTCLVKAGTNFDSDLDVLWYMLEMERDNGKKDVYFLSADNYKLLGTKLDGAAATATDYACTVCDEDSVSYLGLIFNEMFKAFLNGDLDNNTEDKITILTDEMVSRLNGAVNF